MEILRQADGSITFQTMVTVTVPAGTSMLEAEILLMEKINDVGTTLRGHLLTARDAPARPFGREGRRFTAKSKKEVRHAETPYGCAVVWRRAFQSSLGGVCTYPMDEAACLIGAATPKFAQMVSRKLVELPAAEAVRDLRDNHARKVTVDFVQRLTGLVGSLAAATVPAPLTDSQDLPEPGDIKVISIGWGRMGSTARKRKWGEYIRRMKGLLGKSGRDHCRSAQTGPHRVCPDRHPAGL